jgi:hypothetical protein
MLQEFVEAEKVPSQTLIVLEKFKSEFENQRAAILD